LSFYGSCLGQGEERVGDGISADSISHGRRKERTLSPGCSSPYKLVAVSDILQCPLYLDGENLPVVVQMLHKILSSVGPTDTFPFPYFL
jgi:hypothetical protein